MGSLAAICFDTGVNHEFISHDTFRFITSVEGKKFHSFNFDDSIISDPKERKQMFWGYVTAGKFPFWRYLVEFEGYSEADAKAIAAEADAENKQPELNFGGGA